MKEEITSRRAVLRGALAVGCGLCLPVVLFGCDSKPKPGTSSGSGSASAPPASTPPATAANPVEPATTPAAAVKVPQASVQYQPQPKGDQKCADCQHFVAGSNTCALVEGEISSEGWCTLWVKKA